MKKYLFVSFLLLVSSAVFSQSFSLSIIVSECINRLGQGVPDGFSRTNRTNYVKMLEEGEAYFVSVGDEKVAASGYLLYKDSSNTARQSRLSFISFFEDNGWQFVREIRDGDLFRKDSVYVCVTRSIQNRNNLWFSFSVVFSTDLSFFGL